MRSFFCSAIAISFLAAACGDDGSGPPKAGPPTALTALTTDTLEGEAGKTLSQPLSVKLVDKNGNGVPNALVTFSIPLGGGSLSATGDTTSADGIASVVWTLGQSVGNARAEAKAAGVVGAAVFHARIKAGPPTLLQRVSTAPGTSAGGFELADSVSIMLSDAFGNPVAGQTVSFSVGAGGGKVSPATGTTRSDGIARTNWVLGTSGAQSLTVKAAGLESTVGATAAACTQASVPVGAVLTLGPADPKCLVLSGSAQRYVVTVVNTANTVNSTNAFRMRGAGAGTGTTSGDVAAARVPSSFGLSASAARARVEEAREQVKAHNTVLNANEQVLQNMLPKAGAIRSEYAMRSQSAMRVPPPAVGDIVTLNIPGNFANLCSMSGTSTVRARVVFAGQHGVMLEDTMAALKGQMDTLYQRVGQEFDNTMWSVLTTNFGNPLAMDDLTDNNGRFFMLFSPVVNTIQGGNIAGFVASSDFFPPSQCASSNQAEIFYARVPTSTAAGFASGTAGDWYRRTRTVMIHEVKHIVSFAERIRRRMDANTGTPSGFSTADRWLEESSAMMAEELWARTVFGFTAKSNVNYAASIHCEVRLNETNFPECPQPYKPLSMFDHFILFYDYQSNIENLSPIGPAIANDFTFYGSGWSFLRWLVDTHANSESGFLTALTREVNLPGVQNIEARTGKSFVELINDWAIAVAMDDYPAFTPQNAKHQLVSWNTRDIFAGMSRDFSNQGFFTRPVPLQARPVSFGKFALDVGSVRGGSMSVFEVTGTQASQQMFEFNGVGGSSLPAEMRVNIIRVQ